MTLSSAPAKLILCGEHAVVYGRPAIALPLGDMRARAVVEAGTEGSGLRIGAPDIGRAWAVAEAPDNPLSELVLATLARIMGAASLPDLVITLRSEIPIASGMGSGAAVATALVRGLAAYFGTELPADQISALVYNSERRYHGTPSGIDNTVIAYERPVWFQKQYGGASVPAATVEPITIAAPLTLLIADTGVRSATRLPVGEVRGRRQAEPARYEALFDRIGAIVVQVRAALAQGEKAALGPLLNANQELLEVIGVSSPALGRLVAAARNAGALGAKLSGAGWGGVMLALVEVEHAAVADALRAAGATRVLATTVVPAPSDLR
jgi:mevalonate kinase